MKKMKKILTVGLFLLILGGCTAETNYFLQYHKWIPVEQLNQHDSSLKKTEQGEEVMKPPVK